MARINYQPGLVFCRQDITDQVLANSGLAVLDDEPVEGTEQVLRNGVETRAGNTRDYTISGKSVTIRFPVFSGRTKVVVKYFCRRGGC